VLVVEDDEDIRRLVTMALFDEGYEVLSASNGAIALEHSRQHRPDVVLLDMNMPIMDGWEYFRRLREGPGPHTPVVVMTAAASAQARAEQLGAEDHLGKPFDLDDLLRVIERQLGGTPGRGARRRVA
jgi:CheY-like chemotaxis protein